MAPGRLERYLRRQYGLHGQRRYLSPDASRATYSVLSTRPPIFYVGFWLDERLRSNVHLRLLFDHLRTQPAHFLYAWSWWIEEPARAGIVAHYERRHRRGYPRHEFLHLCNTQRQQEVFAEAGLTAVFCNQNALVDERIFRPIDSVPKRYDAVYDARLKEYKRHKLASQVESLALIYAFSPNVDDPDYVEEARRTLAHAHFFNHAASPGYSRLAPDEVNRCLNECRVGLCLSEVEGAMYASIQYLLAGLPVVSTASRGGRDVFFYDPYTLIVEADPAAVRKGVETMIARQIPAALIREKTLEKTAVHRQTLIQTVQDIYDREGAGRNFAEEWPAVFFNTLVRSQRHADVIDRLAAER